MLALIEAGSRDYAPALRTRKTENTTRNEKKFSVVERISVVGVSCHQQR